MRKAIGLTLVIVLALTLAITITACGSGSSKQQTNISPALEEPSNNYDNDGAPLDAPGTTVPTKIASSEKHIVGVRTDGTVVAAGDNEHDECEVSDWTNVVSVAAGKGLTAGLRSDGTVITTGWFLSRSDIIDASDWTDVIQIYATGFNLIGLRSDGTVVAKGNAFEKNAQNSDKNWIYDRWTNVSSVNFDGPLLGIDKNGNLLRGSDTTVRWPDYDTILSWDNIVDVTSVGAFGVIGLDKNRNILIDTNSVPAFALEIMNWQDIINIAGATEHIVGLKSDGTVLALGEVGHLERIIDVSGWEGIIEIAVDDYHTIGLRADGTVLVAGESYYSKQDVATWNLSD